MSGAIRLFDKALLDRHRRRALRAAVPDGGGDFLYRLAADEIVERLAAVTRTFSVAAEIGSPSAYLADRLTGISTVLRFDRIAEALADRRHPAAVGDAEALPLAEGAFDLIVSALHLHWVDDLPGALAQIRRALKPDGLMMASLLGGDTLVELREALTAAEVEISGGASPRVAPFADLRSTGALLQRAGFALPVIDMDRRIVRYASAIDLMRDLRAMGATNALLDRDRRPLRRAVLTRAGEIYAERFAERDGRIPATFEVISLSGWSPHESQQKPLRPGSAKARLADVLRTTERPAGDKAKR
jgi:SAM-dependent methyltransferase